MNEPVVAETPTSSQSSPPSAGSLLRRAREAAGLHIAALAVSLKVPTRKLEALESDRYDELPDAVFTRALALSVCRSLKIDPEPVLQALPQSGKPQLVGDGSGMNVPFERPGQASGASLLGQLPRPALVSALLLLLGALVVFSLPEDLGQQRVEAVLPLGNKEPVESAVTPPPLDTAAPSPLPPPVSAVPEVIKPPAAAAPLAALPVVRMPAEPVVPSASSKSVAPMPVGGAVQAVAPAGGSASSPAALPSVGSQPSVPVSAAGRDGVQFKTRAASWVEVVDARGTVLLRRNLEAGEQVSVSGVLPLAVVVGRADVTDVLVRGKPFSLANVANENVARFEVKP